MIPDFKTQRKPVRGEYYRITENQSSGIMTNARDIGRRASGTVSHSLSISPTMAFHSPTMAFHSPHSSQSFLAGGGFQVTPAKQLKPFNTGDIKILLLENVNQSGIDILQAQGYQVESLKASLPEAELIEKIRCVTPSILLRPSEEAEFRHLLSHRPPPTLLILIQGQPPIFLGFNEPIA